MMKFLGTKDEGSIKLVGIPLDLTVSYRPGTRFAYGEIVKASIAIETFSPYQFVDLEDFDIEDIGEIELPLGNLDRSLSMIEEFVDGISSHPFLIIGGEHLLTYPVIKSLKKRYDDLVILHLDAHMDMRDEYLGEKLSHATTMRRVVELGVPVFSMGVRSFVKEEYDFVRGSDRVRFSPFRIDFDMLKDLSGRSLYVSFDADVIDPSFLPGVGTPEPNGITIKEVMDLINYISGLDVRIVGIDFVEVNPIIDPTGNTAVTASFLVRELLLLLSRNVYK